MKAGILTLVAVVFLAGCAASSPYGLYDNGSKSAQFPSISVLVDDGYVSGSTSCTQYGCQTYEDKTFADFVKALKKTNKFEKIQVGNSYAEYKMDVHTNWDYKDGGVMAFTKLMIGAGSLFLIPVRYDATYTVDVDLMHEKQLMHHYHYTRDIQHWQFLLIDPDSYERNAVKSVVNNLVHDLNADNEFSNHA